MASFSAGTTFTDGVANDVTAAKLGALVNNATPTSGLIQDRTAETITATNDTLLIGDASDSNNLKRITVANFAQTLPTAKVTTGTIVTATLGTTTGTAASFSGDLTIADKIVHSGDTNTAIRFPAADTVTIETSGSEHMRVDSSGRVGIGTSSPKGRLEVSNTLLSGETGSQCIFPLSVTIGNGGNAYGSIGYNLDYRSATDNTTGVKYLVGDTISQLDFNAGGFIFRNAPSGTVGSTATLTERLRIDSSGNVGIGTASPSAKLDVNGNVNFASTAYLSWGTVVGDNAIQGGSPANTLRFFTANSERLRIDSSGNVGIGTTSPSTKLHVDSGSTAQYGKFNSTAANGGYLTFESSSTVHGDIGTAAQVVSGGSASDFGINARGSRNLVLGTNNTERLRIDSDGDVSIGTATALSKLHVHGNITLSNTTTATSAGTSTITPPATVAGYLTVSINGTSRKIPYYAT